MTSPVLQDIVAVLASPAAGNPAQYLLERTLAAAGLDWQAITCDVPPDRLAAAVAGAAALGLRGCLLSGPLRAPALGLATSASPAATFAGGAGLLVRTPEGFMAHMTDGRAVMESVRSHLDPSGREVLVLGAGMSGRAVALEMALAGATAIGLADPDASRASALAGDLGTLGSATATTLDWGTAVTVPERVTIIVRTLSEPAALVGLRSDMLFAEVAAESAPPPETVAAGCCLVRGLDVRADQAAIDFQTLTGLETDVELLRDALDEYLS